MIAPTPPLQPADADDEGPLPLSASRPMLAPLARRRRGASGEAESSEAWPLGSPAMSTIRGWVAGATSPTGPPPQIAGAQALYVPTSRPAETRLHELGRAAIDAGEGLIDRGMCVYM